MSYHKYFGSLSTAVNEDVVIIHNKKETKPTDICFEQEGPVYLQIIVH